MWCEGSGPPSHGRALQHAVLLARSGAMGWKPRRMLARSAPGSALAYPPRTHQPRRAAASPPHPRLPSTLLPPLPLPHTHPAGVRRARAEQVAREGGGGAAGGAGGRGPGGQAAGDQRRHAGALRVLGLLQPPAAVSRRMRGAAGWGVGLGVGAGCHLCEGVKEHWQKGQRALCGSWGRTRFKAGGLLGATAEIVHAAAHGAWPERGPLLTAGRLGCCRMGREAGLDPKKVSHHIKFIHQLNQSRQASGQGRAAARLRGLPHPMGAWVCAAGPARPLTSTAGARPLQRQQPGHMQPACTGREATLALPLWAPHANPGFRRMHLAKWCRGSWSVPSRRRMWRA